MIADAVMACWGMDKWITTTYPYDEKDFKRIDGTGTGAWYYVMQV